MKGGRREDGTEFDGVSATAWVVPLAKISPPERNLLVKRPRLSRAFDPCNKNPLVWICAPPGAGKTTLALQRFLALRQNGAWLQLDPGDSDPATFFHFLSLAIERATPFVKTPLPRLTDEYTLAPEVFARRYFEQSFARFKAPFVLIFDGYSALTAESLTHEMLREGLQTLPPGGQMIVAGRTMPPPGMARLRVEGRLRVIDGKQLRLTDEECACIVEQRQGSAPAPDLVRRLQERNDGWVAGIVLMLECAGASAAAELDAFTAPPDVIFEYFGNEVLARLDVEQQKLLMALALLPIATRSLARLILGREDAEDVLDRLCQHNFFIERRFGPETEYQFHPLFLHFLRNCARTSFDAASKRKLRLDAGRLLQDTGRHEEAALVLQQACDWNGLAQITLRLAETLVRTGRKGVLQAWIRSLPAPIVDTSGWFHYWSGRCLVPENVTEAEREFELAFSIFARDGDAVGLYLAWSAGADSVALGWGLLRMRPWLERYEQLRARYPDVPLATTGPSVVGSVLACLMMHQPSHPERSYWAGQARGILEERLDATNRLMLGSSLLLHDVMFGDMGKAKALVETLAPLASTNEATPLARILWYAWECLYQWCAGNRSDCLAADDAWRALAEDHGVHVVTSLAEPQRVYLHLTHGEPQAANDALAKLRTSAQAGNRLDAAHYHMLAAWRDVLHRDLVGAAGHADEALRRVVKVAAGRFPEGQVRLIAALVSARLKDRTAMHAHLDRVRRLARDSGLRHLGVGAKFIEAGYALDAGLVGRATQCLKTGLRLAADLGVMNWVGFEPAQMAVLCAVAMASRIEDAYVRRLVRCRGLHPPKTRPLGPDGWPWSARIHALGRIEVHVDDRPENLANSAHRRSLDLLTALVCLGGRRVSVDRVAEMLWPDSEGDKAIATFEVTVHRLRKILGRPSIVLVSGSQIFLNPETCWLDLWDFESALDALEGGFRGPRTSVLPEEIAGRVSDLRRLYRGDLLASEPDTSLLCSARDRLKDRYLKALIGAGRALRERSALEAAVQCYESAMALDPTAHEPCHGLMDACFRLGRRSDALTAYDRHRGALELAFSVHPCERTEALRQKILHFQG